MPTPAIMCQLTLRGSSEILSLTRANVMPKIPIGLPSSMPKYTPSVTGSVSSVLMSTPTRRTCAFTNAKIGRITKLTGVEIRRSMRISGGVTRCMTRSTLVVETVKSCWPRICASSSYRSSSNGRHSPNQSVRLSSLTPHLAGMVKAKMTPASVACTPLLNMQNHNSRPSTEYGARR